MRLDWGLSNMKVSEDPALNVVQWCGKGWRDKNRDWIATHKEQSSVASEQRDEVKRDLCVCVCVLI